MSGGLFNKSSFGLDAGDGSIKFVELINAKNSIKLGRHGEYKVHNKKELKETLSSLKKIFGSKPVHLSLPRQDKENMEEHVLALKNFGIKTGSSEHRIHAIGRSVIKKGDLGTYMVVNFGGGKSDIFVVSGGVLTHHLAAPGAIYLLRDEIARHFLSWHTEKDKNRPHIQKIIVCGSGPDLLQFSEHLAVNMRHKAEMANVWINILDTSERTPEINYEQSLGFAAALGAALKGL